MTASASAASEPPVCSRWTATALIVPVTVTRHSARPMDGAATRDADGATAVLGTAVGVGTAEIDGDAAVTAADGTVAGLAQDYPTAGTASSVSLSFPDNGNFTVFGKVTRGLDVARKIFMRPTIIDDGDAGSHRPEKPVVIRKVTIHERRS